jgi:hypothetical protein
MRQFSVTVSKRGAAGDGGALSLRCQTLGLPDPESVALACALEAPELVARQCVPPVHAEPLALQCTTDANTAPVEAIPTADPHHPIPSSTPVSPLSES